MLNIFYVTLIGMETDILTTEKDGSVAPKFLATLTNPDRVTLDTRRMVETAFQSSH